MSGQALTYTAMDRAAPEQSRICRLVEWMPPRWVLLTLLCAVLLFRGRVVERFADSLERDPDAYAGIAYNISRGDGFSFAMTIGPPIPTAARPPLYPLVLVPLMWSHLAVEMGYGVVNVLLGTATVCATWYLGRVWSLPPGVCLVAAALVTVDPILLAQSVQIMTETPAALLATLALLAFTRWARSTSILAAVAAGVTGGLCVLCRPEFLVFVLAAFGLFPFLAVPLQRTRRLAVYSISAALVIAPWAVRNYDVVGRPVITTTHGGFTLLLANNPDFYEYLRSAPWGSTWDGSAVYDKQPEPGMYDEIEQDWSNYRQAFENIGAERGMFLWSCVVRVGRLWGVLPHQTSPDESNARRGMRYAVAIWYTFELALAAIGAWFLRGKLFKNPWVWGTLLVLSITAVHAFYWTDMRMRAPLVGVVALAAASGLVTLAGGPCAPSRLARSV